MKRLSILPSNRAQLSITLFIIFMLTLAGGYVFLHQENKTTIKALRQQLTSVTQLKTEEISLWYLDELHDAKVLASNDLIAEEFEEWLQNAGHDPTRRIYDYLKTTQVVHGLSDVGIASMNGHILFTANEAFNCLDEVVIQAIKKSITSEAPISTGLYRCSTHGKNMIDFLAPIMDVHETPLGVMIFRIDPEINLYPKLSGIPESGYSQESYLIAIDNDTIRYLSPLRYQEEAALSFYTRISADHSIFNFLRVNEPGLYTGVDYREIPVISYISPVQHTPWLLVTEIDSREIQQVFLSSSWHSFIIVLATILLLTLSMLFIYTYRQRKAYKSLLRKERELWSKQEEFRLIAEKSAENIWITDMDFRFKYISPSITRLRRVSVEVAMNQELKDFVIPESLSLVMRTLNEELLKEGQPNVDPNRSIYIELEEYLPDGTTIWVANTISILRDETGKPNGILGISRDVSEKHQTIKALEDAIEKASESDRLKTAFLNNMSHEIRTPLNGIIGFLDLIGDPALDMDERRSFMQIIQQNSQQLLSVIEDIIQIATIEAGQEQLRESYANINLILENLQQQFQPKTKPGVLSLQVNSLIEDTKAFVVTDKTKLLQVLSNLLGNAFKFTKKGFISCQCTLEDNHIKFSVRDTGIGIPPDFHDVIFERFRQVDEAHTRQYGGNGLGLAICKAYVSLLGGRIWVDSTPGMGSTFSFTIPYHPAPGIQMEAGIKPMEGGVLQGITILVAEDEYSNYELLEIILGKQHAILIHAENGKEAIEACRNHPDIKLVLMDIKMPGVNGYEATQEIKDFRPDLPIIALTAHALQGSREEALSIGCDDYLAKPVRKQDLLDTICKYLT